MSVRRSSVFIGKVARRVSRLRGGAGSALPGLVVEKIDRGFIADCLGQLPRGVVVVTGTNGKTTTTKIVVELLEAQGLKVFTNRTGSNFTRGVIAALLESVDSRGRLAADIAVLELDEAWAARFVEMVKPRYCLLLNVMRDQLDRFGEIDTTAKMLSRVAEATTEVVIVNREDRRLVGVGEENGGGATEGARVEYFGLSEGLRVEFPEDEEMFGAVGSVSTARPTAKVVLEDLHGQMATFRYGRKSYRTKLALEGVYNAYNAAGALALVSAILPEVGFADFIPALKKIASAFGRGEDFMVGGDRVKLVLVKNPSGFQLALRSFKGAAVMIAINDEFADGRDMSWLWNVDFSGLAPEVAVVSGVRAADMALRLKYDNVTAREIMPDFIPALKMLAEREGEKCIFATYTAMLAIRRVLAGRSII
jgi:UDP-N-acetylmuramyl tripeptide synthase